MKLIRSIQVVDTHNAGEPMRIITTFIPGIIGETMAQKQDYFKKNYDSIRSLIILEPRGHSDMFGGVFCEPTSPKAHLGMLFFDTGLYYHMCGHGAMAAALLAVELGMVKGDPPKTQVILDTPAGLITLEVMTGEGERSVVMYSSPSFLEQEDIILNIEGEEIKVTIAFGGNFFALVEKEEFSKELKGENIPYFLKWGMAIMEEVNKVVSLHHPLYPHIHRVTDVMFCERISRTYGKNLVVLGDGQFDRSPCGTGTSARLATLYAKGHLQLGEEYIHESLLGTHFKAIVEEEVFVGTRSGVIIKIKSYPFITGFNHLVVEEGDPFSQGFTIKRFS